MESPVGGGARSATRDLQAENGLGDSSGAQRVERLLKSENYFIKAYGVKYQ